MRVAKTASFLNVIFTVFHVFLLLSEGAVAIALFGAISCDHQIELSMHTHWSPYALFMWSWVCMFNFRAFFLSAFLFFPHEWLVIARSGNLAWKKKIVSINRENK